MDFRDIKRANTREGGITAERRRFIHACSGKIPHPSKWVYSYLAD